MSGDAGEDSEEAYRASTPASASLSRSSHPSMTPEFELSDVSDVDLHVLDPSLQPTQGMGQLDESGDGEVDAATAAGIQELRGYIHGLQK